MSSPFAVAPAPTTSSAPTAVLLDRAARAPGAGAVPDLPSGSRAERPDVEGFVVFAVGATSYAVPVAEVGAVLRPERLDLLVTGERPRHGRGVALVDVRGRAIPVVDLRSDPDLAGEVLLPHYRHHVGLVVDRVLSVLPADDLVPEPDGLPDVLPSYARGVLRPVDGGVHVLLVAMPDAAGLVQSATP